MGMEGGIRIDLRLADDAVQEVNMVSSRPVHASRVLEGKPVDEALALLPLLFSVCATAQSCAGARACEQALGIAETAAATRRRELMVKLEALREHLWRIFLDWPKRLGEEPGRAAMQQVVRLQGALSGVLDPGQDLFSPGADPGGMDDGSWQLLTEKLAQLLEAKLFGQLPSDWLESMDVAALEAWSADTPTVAARLLRLVLDRGWADVGNAAVAPLPSMEACELVDSFSEETFVETPLWRGEPRETTALTRQQGSVLVQALRERWGKGLLPRLVARLVEVARLCMDLQMLSAEPPPFLHCPGRAGLGLGQAEAARGRLIQLVRIEDRRIRQYRILAPTEWNFHPRGVVARGLGALRGSQSVIRDQADLFIESIDPCVSYELNLHA